MSATKRAYIKNYGCQMNVYDAERMGEHLAAHGYAAAASADDADIVLLNTCHIREKAAEKIYSELGRLRDQKAARAKEGRALLIGVAGCVAQAEGSEIVRRQPAVDLVVGPQSYHRLAEMIAKAGDGGVQIDTDFPEDDKFGGLVRRSRKAVAARGVTAFLTVQEGCDKFCSFCVVPYTRGSEQSRPVGAIVEEAAALAQAGVREITLLGQNVNAYHGEAADGSRADLAGLLWQLSQVPGVERLRYTTSHPRDMSQPLIEAHRDLPALMPYLHLPVQSGSDRILAAMNRRHDRDTYLRLIERIRTARPDIALSGDFIVGFPGESDADFEQTLALVREVGYACAFSFKYSPRPGTPAADRCDQVPEQVKTERLHALQALLAAGSRVFNEGLIGRHLPVLLEKRGRHAGQLVGRSPYLQPVQVDAPSAAIGRIVTVLVTAVGTNSLFGMMVPDGAAADPASPFEAVA